MGEWIIAPNLLSEDVSVSVQMPSPSYSGRYVAHKQNGDASLWREFELPLDVARSWPSTSSTRRKTEAAFPCRGTIAMNLTYWKSALRLMLADVRVYPHRERGQVEQTAGFT